ncbi:response regulator transcription factor [Intrasporangium sp. YIM S08009]|uniref:response regulator transcription factor n=1 Tax=Intrasporangium zincisolvens TaxID=3080018 RepID=UPI002B05C5BB|nr:response regulator transcription factor [Intrasporangium sp. YIM S08009]
METVLVVEDDTTVSGVVAAYLERAGLGVEVVVDGLDAVASVARRRPDLVLLDVMLPGLDGLEVCRRVRRLHPDLPVVMLTAHGEEHDRIAGLELGADDYVTKPFSPRELALRVQSILRRARGADAPAATAAADPGGTVRAELLVDGDLTVDGAGRRVHLGGAETALTTREFDLLAWFVGHPGRVFTRTDLMRSVWGWEFGDESTVTVHVRRVREKVEADPSAPRRLVTVFGVGYRWDPAPPASPSTPGLPGDAAAPEAAGGR